MTHLVSTERFSDRVADYVKYRPDYPGGLIAWLHASMGVPHDAVVADIGAGTGISSKMFLDAGHRVLAVEPNGPMREAALAWLGEHTRFSVTPGRAEATELPDRSVDLVASARAFHWFDQEAVKPEWRRISRPGALVAVFWNSRRLEGTPFLEGFEALLRRFGTDYSSVSERYGDDEHMTRWFGAGFRGATRLPHSQTLDLPALRGRLASSSYAPREGDPRHVPMMAALDALFAETSREGVVHFDYDTRIFCGTLE